MLNDQDKFYAFESVYSKQVIIYPIQELEIPPLAED